MPSASADLSTQAGSNWSETVLVGNCIVRTIDVKNIKLQIKNIKSMFFLNLIKNIKRHA